MNEGRLRLSEHITGYELTTPTDSASVRSNGYSRLYKNVLLCRGLPLVTGDSCSVLPTPY